MLNTVLGHACPDRGIGPPSTSEVPLVPMLLDSRWCMGTGHVAIIVDPESGGPIAQVPMATAGDVELALAAAHAAEDEAAHLPPHERSRILATAANRVLEVQDLFSTLIASEGVKTIREARLEVERCANTLRLSAEEALRLGGESIVFDQVPAGENRTGYTLREPIGLIVAITPFNDPLNLVAHKIGPAIAAGNVVILKPHEATPLSALALAEILIEAGLPAAFLQVLPAHGAEIGDALVGDPRVRMVSFTGGRRTGEHIARRAGAKRLALELGGTCHTIIMPDAELEQAVAACVSGAFWAAGQNCLHVQRILVHRDAYQKFRTAFLERVAACSLGPKLDESTDMGCLIDERSARRIEDLLRSAVAAGATIAIGGHRQGTRFWPTVVEDVPPTHPLAREEVFGPVSVLSPFGTLDEAIAISNAADLGLQAAIFTSHLTNAHIAIRDLRAGAVIVNDSTDYRIDAMPFGGIRGSGIGREGVRHAVLEMTELKMVCFHHQIEEVK